MKQALPSSSSSSDTDTDRQYLTLPSLSSSVHDQVGKLEHPYNVPVPVLYDDVTCTFIKPACLEARSLPFPLFFVLFAIPLPLPAKQKT